MNDLIIKFYKFKRFLIRLNVMTIPLAEFVFNLQHNRIKRLKPDYPGSKLNEEALGNILSYIPYTNSSKFIAVNKKFKESFKCSNNIMISEILKEVIYTKIQLMQKLNKKMPVVFYHNMFSEYFLMIDEIVNNEFFFSKEQINDIKNIKVENPLVIKISRIILNLLNEKVEKKILSSGEIKYLYLEKLKQLAVNGTLFKSIQAFNKLDISMSKFLNLYEDLDELFSLDKLEQIKKSNRGIAQLVNWIIFVFEFNKIVNPFDFISSDYLTNRFEKEDLELITYYIEVIKYLKTSLKVKFKFTKNFEFRKHFEKLKKFLISQKINYEQLFVTNQEYLKITEIYLQTKDVNKLYL